MTARTSAYRLNDLAQLMEVALSNETCMESGALHFDAVLINLKPLLGLVKIGGLNLNKNCLCNMQGNNCTMDGNSVDNVLKTIGMKCLQADKNAVQFACSSFLKTSASVLFLLQHWVVVHLKCLTRLLMLCKLLLQSPVSCEQGVSDMNFNLRLSFNQRILKLLGKLIKEITHECDFGLFHAVANYADTLPSLFRMNFDILQYDLVASDDSFVNILLLILDEFIQFVHIMFCQSSVSQVIKACVVSSMLEALDSNLWRLDGPNFSSRLPVVYCPQIVMYMLKLIKEVKNWAFHMHWWEGMFAMLEPYNSIVSCHIHHEEVSLFKNYTYGEYSKMIFPPYKQWVDDLIHLSFFLHSQGARLWKKVDKSRQSCSKSFTASETDSAANHEEEALFGNLFLESSRSGGSSDGHDQATTTPANISCCYNLPIQAATEILSFLKDDLFSLEQNSVLFEDFCQKVDRHAITRLLTILNFGDYSCNERNAENCSDTASHRTMGPINQCCFELLHEMLARQVLSSSLLEHLVDEIVKVESGVYIYNHFTLILLAHAVTSQTGSSGCPIAIKIYQGYCDYIVDRMDGVISCCPDRTDLLATLPCSFHVEILLIAFHLCNEVEKRYLINSLLLYLRKTANLQADLDSLQLFCWALLVSRLVLVLRHVVLNSSSCPSWLLLLLRSRLRKTSMGVSIFPSSKDHLPSLAANLAENLLGNRVKEKSIIGRLLPLLIDVSPVPSMSYCDGHAFHCLGLNCIDLFGTFSFILDSWKGRKAEGVEDLILERYMFTICWDTVSAISSGQCSLLPRGKWTELQLSSAESLFQFGHFVLFNHKIMCNNSEMAETIIALFQQLFSVYLPKTAILQGWDFLRIGTWLSLLLCLFNTTIRKYSIRHEVSGMEPHHVLYPMDTEFLHAELISILSQTDKCRWFLGSMSSILKAYLNVLRQAFLSAVDHSDFANNGFSPLLFIKHTRFDKYKQDILLQKTGIDSLQLESVSNLSQMLETISSNEDKEMARHLLLGFLLHGFPSNTKSASAALLSGFLTVKGVLCVLDGYIKLKNATGNFLVENDVLSELLNCLMEIKYDRFFRPLHKTCESIYTSVLTFNKQASGYDDLFLLKQMTSLVDINNRDVSDDIHEMLIISLVDIIEDMRRDDSKLKIFNFFVGSDTNMSQDANALFSSQHGDLLVLVDALDKCHSETVNLKVLNLFVDLLSGGCSSDLNEKLQNKFLGMDSYSLSHWIGSRMLGFIVESSGVVEVMKGSSASLRESVMNFVSSLVCQPHGTSAEKLRSHFFQAMLMPLDSASVLHDIHIAKDYFSFVVQLSSDEFSIKQLLEKTLLLMEILLKNENSLHGLKFLIGFFGQILGEYGTSKTDLNKVIPNICTNNSLGAGQVISKYSKLVKKSSENLLIPSNPVGSSASMDCDATSADDDDDDGTSEGELGSMDKEDEEASNNERALATKVCTFTSSGSNFMEQHWYFCYTCDLTVSKGCCSICAKICHRGHRVVYSRSSRFFCDCGAGGVRGSTCQCLKPRKVVSSNHPTSQGASNLQSLLPFPHDDQLPSDSDLGDDDLFDFDMAFKFSIPEEVQDRLPIILEDLDMEGRVLKLCNNILPSVISWRDSNLCEDKKVILGDDKIIKYSTDLFQLKKAYKSGSLDMKIKNDYPNSRELKSHLASGSLVKSLLSVSVRGRLAAGEGDKVSIFDVGQLIGQPSVGLVTADKSNVKPLSRNVVRFEITHILFNPMTENYLAVAGYEECQVLTVNTRGEVTDRLAIELALQGAYIRQVLWVPGSQVQLMVVTSMFVKIYDLSHDNISPSHYFTLTSDIIMDAVLVPTSMGKVFLLVLSEAGDLFRLELAMGNDIGAKTLNDIIHLHNKDAKHKGQSLYFSSIYRLLFLTYQDGTVLMGRLDSSANSLTEKSVIYEEDQDGKVRPAGLHHWKELPAANGIFVSYSSRKSNGAHAVSFGSHGLVSQNLRHGAASILPLVGIAAYKPLSKDKVHYLVLQDDGSLQIYTHVQVGVDNVANTNREQTKKIGSSILNNRAYTNPDFPLDFFEKTICITADVKMSSDCIQNNDSECIKQRLTSDDGFLESSSPDGFKVTVSNMNPDIVMVGIRIHVGNTSASHIPSNTTIFQRVIKLDEGMRSWYDIPFTFAESLLADEEFTISIGRTFDGSSSPRIDSLDVYGRAKDEFGWKEKIDAVLDMEANVLGSSSISAAASKRFRAFRSAPIEEQVLAEAIHLLSRLYSLCRSRLFLKTEDISLELNKLKCKKLLETIFQSDSEPLLQSVACRVLQAVFPKRDIYYHVKDTMRLLGVVNSYPLLLSRLGAGGDSAGLVVREFTAQMRAVSKIALHRRSNFATFIENHGTVLVDGLMQVLWGILDMERPDTQTINKIVVPSVELIYSYAECLALHESEASGYSVAPAVGLLKKLLFAPYEAVQTSSSLAISSRLLQVPFPKQTMLAPDDSVDSQISSHAPPDMTPSGGNPQLTIEEDSATSSVQYCCDGCSTVPILQRRWHCNICPDFDLCEACYEVLDSGRLPPPHSRDHPMSAITIEVDSVGVDGHEIHFSMDELNDSGVIRTTAVISTQNSPSTDHVLDKNEAAEFPTNLNDQRIVSISASKRAVNSLILMNLIGDLKGWMETTSGARAIPVMQLFYRLSSALGGPFMDGSKPGTLDLEKFALWLIDELCLIKPFPSNSRSSFGEVAILVFMFFNLMLRSWLQPGSDSSQSKSASVTVVSSNNDDQQNNEFGSQLMRPCSALREQEFVNYLMNILQQLSSLFKSTLINVENNAGYGSLLTIRRELPAGNFSPFFSDSYAKAHRADLFVEYHKLLLENTFRLVYSLVKPEKVDKHLDKDRQYKSSGSKDLNLDGFQDVLCNYISNPHTTFVRRYARRLLLHLCGSKTHYYGVRDSWQFSNEINKLYRLVSKSGGLLSSMPYERSVKLVNCLSAMSEVAGARPRNWQKYCLKHTDILPFLINGIFHLAEEAVIQILKLLSLVFFMGKDACYLSQKTEGGEAVASSNKGSAHQSLDTKKKGKGEDGTENGSEKSSLDMEQAVEIFCDKDSGMLKNFIQCFLLEWNSSNVRSEAKSVLHGIWQHSKQSFKQNMLGVLLEKMKFLPTFGQNILEYVELMTLLLGKLPESGGKQFDVELVILCLTPDVTRSISKTLHSQNELLANHPNSRLYSMLSTLVEFDGYYLESEPCVACSCPEIPYSRMKLESFKSETKFTDNRIIVKCNGSYTIRTVMMNVHDARKSKSVKIFNLYYNNRPVSDLSELKNNWSLWKRAKSCHLSINQTEVKVEFVIPITACNIMVELDSFYENLQASSLEALQCPRCSRPVTDKHGICSNCHENAYQCRQCRNINYENLDSFLCNECGYSKYGRFEFNFMAKPSFSFDNMENDDDLKKGLGAIEAESENAHRRYQQLLGFKKPLLKLVSSIGEHEIDSQQKDTVQQMMVSIPGPSCKINRKIALLGVLYGEKCKAAFDSVSKSVQTLQGLRQVLMTYLHQKNSDHAFDSIRFPAPRSSNNCYGCATTFVTQCMELLHVLSKYPNCKKQLVGSGILSELFENNIHQGPKAARVQARTVLCAFSEGDASAVSELNALIQKKVMYCLEHHRSMDIAVATREELLLLSETCSLVDEFWEARLRVAFQLLFSSIKVGAKHPAISEHIILPCLRIISQACTPPKSDSADKEQQGSGKSSVLPLKSDSRSNSSAPFDSTAGKASDLSEKHMDDGRKGKYIPLVSYSEWERGASYLDFVRRQYKVFQAAKSHVNRVRLESQRSDYLALKFSLKWKRRTCKRAAKSDFSTVALGSWVSELILSACSQSIRSEVCTLVSFLCPSSSPRRFQLLSLLVSLLPSSLSVGESAAEYFELFFKMIEPEPARLFLTVRGCLKSICRLVTQEVNSIESQERSLHIDISQGFILHKLIELLSKFLEIPNIRIRFMHDNLLSEVLEDLLVIRGLIVQKTKLISDCIRLLKDLLDSLLLDSTENKRQFIRACISGLQNHGKEKKRRSALFILEQLCNMICPSKPEPVFFLILNKAHTQEEFIRGSMTKNPYSSAEIGPLMRDVKNKICHQLDLLGLLEDDYGMELLVAGNIISLDLSISQIYEHVWRKYNSQTGALSNSGLTSSGGLTSIRDCPPMTVTYRLQGLDGEATEPMIKELEEEREESQDPEIEFAIAGAVRECGGLEVLLSMIQQLRDDELKSNQEELSSILDLLMHCCKIHENRRCLLRLGALGLLLEAARRAFSVDAMEPAEGILMIVENLTVEANESDISITQSMFTVNEESGAGEQAKKIVLMFLERLCHPSGLKMSNKQQRNNEMVARILPYLTYGEPAAMQALIMHFNSYLQDWGAFDRLQADCQDNLKDESLVKQGAQQRSAIENFVRVSESLNSHCGNRLKDIILEKGITGAAVRHLRECFAITGQAGFKKSREWAFSLKLPSVPLILSLLSGLSKGHWTTQKCIDDGGILPILHALEGVAGEKEVGARAENLLDTLADKNNGDELLGEKIGKLRNTTRDNMRRRLLKKREELLKGLGMRQEFHSDGGERIVVSKPVIEGLEDVVEEEDGLACMVCREGYSLRPNDILGVYSYSKRVSLGASPQGSARGDCVYTTVSHFNFIHFQCHQEAKRADADLKIPKKEWEGATLRNNETLCNCIFPLKGPSIPVAQYIRCIDQYWDNLNALGHADGSRLRLLTYDIVLMLARFATGASFSTDSKGGGRESNSRFLPFMIQMAVYLIDQGGSNQQRRTMAKSVGAYLLSSIALDSPIRPSSSHSPSRLSGTVAAIATTTGASEESVQFMMVNSLLSESYGEWRQHRPSFLQRGLYHAYMQHKHGRSNLRLSSDPSLAVVRAGESSSTDLEDDSKLFPIIHSMLIYTGLIEQLQQFFKLVKGSGTELLQQSETDEDCSGGSPERWVVAMRERLLNFKDMMALSKEILSWLDDMTGASHMQEAFDVMGALGDALSGGFSSCEEFVKAAIVSGKG